MPDDDGLIEVTVWDLPGRFELHIYAFTEVASRVAALH